MLPDRLAAHLAVSAAAVVLAAVVAALLVWLLPLRWRGGIVGAASVIQTVPGLALLALFYPLLLLVGRLTGLPIPALGLLPALLALALYALLPLLRGGIDGLASVAPEIGDTATAIGMTGRERLLLIDLPLAAPMVMGGLRTAAVWTIGAATLATTVGQKSLGDLIFAGLQLQDWPLVAAGCLAAAGLAIIVDAALGLCQRGLAHRRWRPVIAGGALLGLLIAAVTGWWWAERATATARPVVVGAKNFAEQYILAELIAARLRATGQPAVVRGGLGSAVAFRALSAGDIDVYVDYAGTLWSAALGRSDAVSRETMLATLRRDLPARNGVQVVAALGFENAYALAMPRRRAAALGITSLADLARRRTPELRLATDLEFQSRPEWGALRDAYGLRFAAVTAYTPTLMVQALAGGQADVITAFSSDGRILADDLVLLDDPRGALPAYDALLLAAPGRSALAEKLAGLSETIPVEAMREANWRADRPVDKQSPADAAAWLARRIGER